MDKDNRIKELELASMKLFDMVHEGNLIDLKCDANDLYDTIKPQAQSGTVDCYTEPVVQGDLVAEKGSYAREFQSEISRQYLGGFFEDNKENGLFQVVDVIKEPGYLYASNGKLMIKRKLVEVEMKPPIDWSNQTV